MDLSQYGNYLINPAPYNWHQLLSEWSWILPNEFSVRQVNRFGDLFGVVADGSVHMLDTGGGSLKQLADSYATFLERIADADVAREWLLVPLVDSAAEAGLTLEKGQCYSFKLPPVLGGKYAIDNMFALDLPSHLGAYGSIYGQMAGLPDGSKVVLRATNQGGRYGAQQ